MDTEGCHFSTVAEDMLFVLSQPTQLLSQLLLTVKERDIVYNLKEENEHICKSSCYEHRSTWPTKRR